MTFEDTIDHVVEAMLTRGTHVTEGALTHLVQIVEGMLAVGRFAPCVRLLDGTMAPSDMGHLVAKLFRLVIQTVVHERMPPVIRRLLDVLRDVHSDHYGEMVIEEDLLPLVVTAVTGDGIDALVIATGGVLHRWMQSLPSAASCLFHADARPCSVVLVGTTCVKTTGPIYRLCCLFCTDCINFLPRKVWNWLLWSVTACTVP